MSAEDKSMSHFLCGNHTRGLPIDEFHRQFSAYIAAKFGEETREAKKTNQLLRLETSGQSMVFSILKMCHRGFNEYSKSLAAEIFEELKTSDPIFA